MKAWQNILVQIVGTAFNIGTVAYQAAGSHMIGNGNTANYIGLGLLGLQALSGSISHWYNPDGTPSAAPYITPQKP